MRMRTHNANYTKLGDGYVVCFHYNFFGLSYNDDSMILFSRKKGLSYWTNNLEGYSNAKKN